MFDFQLISTNTNTSKREVIMLTNTDTNLTKKEIFLKNGFVNSASISLVDKSHTPRKHNI